MTDAADARPAAAVPAIASTVPAGDAASAEQALNEFERMPLMQVIRQLGTGELTAEQIPKPVREQCVGHLTYEGFTAADIAKLLQITDRTVRRDRAAARKLDAMPPSLTLGDELLGAFERLALAGIQRMIRFARDPATPPYARPLAEETIIRIHQRLIDTALRMKYLDDGSTRMRHLRDGTDPENDKRFAQQIEKHQNALFGKWGLLDAE